MVYLKLEQKYQVVAMHGMLFGFYLVNNHLDGQIIIHVALDDGYSMHSLFFVRLNGLRIRGFECKRG